MIKNKKGFIITLDSTIAAMLVFLVISAVAYFIIKAQDTTWSEAQLSRTGYDIITLMDQQGIFQKENEANITEILWQTLPSNYGMRVELYRYWYNETGTLFFLGKLEAGDKKPEESQIWTKGERIVIIKNAEGTDIEKFCLAKFWIWLK